MDTAERVYIKLQKHLDSQAVGFPATKSGSEIKILKNIFSPKEAEITTYLSYRSESIGMLFERVRPLVKSSEELEKILDRIQSKGGIESKIINGTKHYCCIPFVVGMYEGQLDRLTPEFLSDIRKYTSDKSFGVAFLSTKLPQMRTIPVSKSIQPQHHASTFDEVASLLQQSEGPFVILDCICRKTKSMEGHACKVTDRKETCMAIGSVAQMAAESISGRKISKNEAMSIIEQNQKEGLVLQPSNSRKAEFICSCCGCCCGVLTTHKILPKPLLYWATNFQAEVDTSTCEGCGNCEESCQVDAMRVSEKEQYAVVNKDRCIGCGVCVSNCPTGSISLFKKPSEVVPPESREELLDIIMDNKKGKFGKFLLSSKLFLDAVRTGQTHLLKP